MYTGIPESPARHPAAYRTSPQPLVLKRRKLLQIIKAMNFFSRIPILFGGILEPERASGRSIKVPLHHGADVSVQLLSCLSYLVGKAQR
jgi:hypothetical protein